MNRIFVTGDTHGKAEERLDDALLLMLKEDNVDRSDVLLIAGDYGHIWATDNSPDWMAEEDKTTARFSKLPYTICFVDGNHENHARLDDLPVVEMFGGKAGWVADNIFHLQRGEIYTINGKTFFVFGGAMSTDKHCRKENFSWWAREIASKEEMQYAVDNLEKHNFSVDYVLTHTFPASIVSEIINGVDYAWHLEGRNLDPVAIFLERLVTTFNLEFKMWFGGHFHFYEKYRDGKFVVLYENIVEV